MERDASWLDLNEDFNDPHTDHRSSKQSSARQKTSGDDNSVDKRDRAPPKSPKYSSLSAKAVLERAESVLEAINEKGCPTAEGVTSNPLYPNISMYILRTVLLTFP